MKEFDPVFSRFCYLWNTILLRIYFFPYSFIIVNIDKISLLNYLKYRTNPFSTGCHVFFAYDITHTNIRYLDRAFFFWFLFFSSFFLIFSCFFSFLCLLFQSCLHFFFIFWSQKCFYNT